MSSELLTVMAVALITWLGVFVYLWRLDSRVKDLEAAQRSNKE
jgi:CcmD family protein